MSTFEEQLEELRNGGRLTLTIRDASGGLIDRSRIELLEGPDAWLEAWGVIVAEQGVTVDLELESGLRLGRLTDHGLELTAHGAIPILAEVFGLLGVKP